MKKKFKDVHLRFDLNVPSHLSILAKIDLIKNKYKLSYTQAFMFYLFPIADMWTVKEDKEAKNIDESASKELRAILSESKENKADSAERLNGTAPAEDETKRDVFTYKEKEQTKEAAPFMNEAGYDEEKLAILLNEVFSDEENM